MVPVTRLDDAGGGLAQAPGDDEVVAWPWSRHTDHVRSPEGVLDACLALHKFLGHNRCRFEAMDRRCRANFMPWLFSIPGQSRLGTADRPADGIARFTLLGHGNG